MTSNIFDIWTVILWVKLLVEWAEIILLEKSPCHFALEHFSTGILGTNACYKKYFTFEQPHTFEQNTPLVINIRG